MEEIVQERQVYDLEKVPAELLTSIEKMGVDNSSILNVYEVKYFDFIFKSDTKHFDFANKKIGFLGNKKDFFDDEKQRFYHAKKTGVGGTALYVFNASQKAESGGYDAAIVYWSKVSIPIDKVVDRLKKQQ